jgi:hypothetical protein
MKFDQSPTINSDTDSKEKSKTPGLKEKLSGFTRKKILTYALLIASSLTGGGYLYDREYGGKDYSQASTFNEAFKKARSDKRKVFRWNGKKFTTDLVDKEFSKTYLESKKFLEDYYNSDYFKSKQKPEGYDLSTIKYEIADTVYRRLTELLEKSWIQKLTKQEKEELSKCENIFRNRDSIEATEEFKKEIDARQRKAIDERLVNLKESTYFSITDKKGDMEEDGSYDPKTKKVFIYKRPDKSAETTSVHELTHKSTQADHTFIYNDKFSEITKKAFESAKNNPSFLGKHSVESFKYLSDPSEIDARQNSARFWLFKHFPGYTTNTAFTREHYDFLSKNYESLPYDIQQLMDLFPIGSDFISNMNTY